MGEPMSSGSESFDAWWATSGIHKDYRGVAVLAWQAAAEHAAKACDDMAREYVAKFLRPDDDTSTRVSVQATAWDYTVCAGMIRKMKIDRAAGTARGT
jgi:hypothetical protein